MVGSCDRAACPFRLEWERWRAVGGGIDSDGNVVSEPWELVKARMIDNLCQRYGCLPSALLAEDIDRIIRMHSILALAGDEQGSSGNAPGNNMEQSLANMSMGQ